MCQKLIKVANHNEAFLKRDISVIQIQSIRITVLVKNKNRENGKIDKMQNTRRPQSDIGYQHQQVNDSMTETRQVINPLDMANKW